MLYPAIGQIRCQLRGDISTEIAPARKYPAIVQSRLPVFLTQTVLADPIEKVERLVRVEAHPVCRNIDAMSRVSRVIGKAAAKSCPRFVYDDAHMAGLCLAG